MIMPVYVAEVSPKESRGMLNSVNGVAYGLGTIAALATNIGLSKIFLGWRIALVLPAFVALIYAVGMIWIPHTPS